jgi:hypothetical protein
VPVASLGFQSPLSFLSLNAHEKFHWVSVFANHRHQHSFVSLMTFFGPINRSISNQAVELWILYHFPQLSADLPFLITRHTSLPALTALLSFIVCSYPS